MRSHACMRQVPIAEVNTSAPFSVAFLDMVRPDSGAVRRVFLVTSARFVSFGAVTGTHLRASGSCTCPVWSVTSEFATAKLTMNQARGQASLLCTTAPSVRSLLLHAWWAMISEGQAAATRHRPGTNTSAYAGIPITGTAAGPARAHLFCGAGSAVTAPLLARAGIVTSLLASLLGQARIYVVLGREGLLPPGLAQLHPRRATPVRATWLAGASAGMPFTGRWTIMACCAAQQTLLGLLCTSARPVAEHFVWRDVLRTHV